MMKTLELHSSRERSNGTRLSPKGVLAAVFVGLIGFTCDTGICLGQDTAADATGAVAAGDVKGVQVLTRGPVHEAFAQTVTFNPEPGVVVAKAPPEAIEEIPPSERPEGNNVTWIPGYWAWDDERNDFLWVSGVWRALPPGRSWTPGYWGKITDGYQWTSGYWADAKAEETTYLPEPPKTVEEGPSTEAPSRDHRWTPGNWAWNQDRYAWSPGYWARGRANWDWMPSHYVWSPRGYVYVDGYWDYPMDRRGTLFAPVYFDSGVYGQAGYSYTPTIALDLAILAENLFLRPRYDHYYFGDYYGSNYSQGGYYSAYAYQSNRGGYDPIFAQQRWSHRNDQGWDQRYAAGYQNRLTNESARPPRTWAAMRGLDATSAVAKQNHLMMAAPIDQMAKRKGGAVQYQAVSKTDRQTLAKRGQEVQQSRDQRRTLEAKVAGGTAAKPGETAAISREKLPRTSIVGKPASQFAKSQAPPPVPRASTAPVKGQAGAAAAGGQPKGGRAINPLPGEKTVNPAPRDKTVNPAPRDKTVNPAPREKSVNPAPREKAVNPQPQPRKVVVAPAPRPVKPQPQPQPRAAPAPRPQPSQPQPSAKPQRNVQPAAQPGKAAKGDPNAADDEKRKKGH